MIIKASKEEEIKLIIEYIGSNYKSTPYIYVNLIKYGVSSEHVISWIDYDKDSIIGVYLLYYDCLHFYTRNSDDYSVETLINFVNSLKPRVVMMPGSMGDRTTVFFEDYYFEKNHVIDMDNVGVDKTEFLSEIASREDIKEIVELLMSDSEYTNVYDINILTAQMLDRFDRKFSRYFIVRIDNRIVATCSTYGEVPGFALVGGVIVHPDYRRRGLAADVENYTCSILNNEGISRVGFVNYNNTASLALHTKLGAVSVGSLVKYVKKV